MAVKFDPKTLIDSVADGAIEVAEGPARVAENLSKVLGTYATEVQSNLDSIKGKLPDDPSILPNAAVKAVGETVKVVIGVFEGIGQGATDTIEAVKKQISRVTG